MKGKARNHARLAMVTRPTIGKNAKPAYQFYHPELRQEREKQSIVKRDLEDGRSYEIQTYDIRISVSSAYLCLKRHEWGASLQHTLDLVKVFGYF